MQEPRPTLAQRASIAWKSHSVGATAVELLCVFAAFYVPPLFITDALSASRHLIFSAALSIPQLLIIVGAMLRNSQSPLCEFGFRKIAVVHAVAAALLSLLLLLLLALYNLVLSYARETPWDVIGIVYEDTSHGQRERVLHVAPLIIAFSFLTAYKEEVLFRSYLLHRLVRSGLPRLLAVGLSAALFAVGHGYQGAGAVLLALADGIILSAVYLRMRNVHVVALAHALYNMLVLFFGLLVQNRLPTIG